MTTRPPADRPQTHLVADIAILTGRSLTHVRRSPDTIVSTAVMPIAIMLLFVFVFGGAMHPGEDGRTAYVQDMLPGILMMTVAMGVSYTAYRLFLDLQRGILDRFDSLPIARSATLWAHVLTSLVANAMSLCIVVATAVALGFRSGAGPLDWLAVAGILLLVILALTWVAVVAGLAASSVEGASAFSYPLIFLPFVSSAFVPTDTMPGPVRWFAEHQPVTAIVDTVRDLLAQRPVDGGDLWTASAWCGAIAVVGFLAATALYGRRVA